MTDTTIRPAVSKYAHFRNSCTAANEMERATPSPRACGARSRSHALEVVWIVILVCRTFASMPER